MFIKTYVGQMSELPAGRKKPKEEVNENMTYRETERQRETSCKVM